MAQRAAVDLLERVASKRTALLEDAGIEARHCRLAHAGIAFKPRVQAHLLGVAAFGAVDRDLRHQLQQERLHLAQADHGHQLVHGRICPVVHALLALPLLQLGQGGTARRVRRTRHTRVNQLAGAREHAAHRSRHLGQHGLRRRTGGSLFDRAQLDQKRRCIRGGLELQRLRSHALERECGLGAVLEGRVSLWQSAPTGRGGCVSELQLAAESHEPGVVRFAAPNGSLALSDCAHERLLRAGELGDNVRRQIRQLSAGG